MGENANKGAEEIDARSSLLICRAVGDTLRKELSPVNSELPGHLEALLQQLELQDEQPRQLQRARR